MLSVAGLPFCHGRDPHCCACQVGEVAVAAGIDKRGSDDHPSKSRGGCRHLCDPLTVALRLDQVAVQADRHSRVGAHPIQRQLGELRIDHDDGVARPLESDLAVRVSRLQPRHQITADAADDKLPALVKESAIAQHRARGRGPAEKRVALDEVDGSAHLSGADCRADAAAAAADHDDVVALGPRA
jgi:hypothetical protein